MVSDVFKISSSDSTMCSFCAAISHQPSLGKIYKPENWPSGAKVRPYMKKQIRSAQSNDSARRHSSHISGYRPKYAVHNKQRGSSHSQQTHKSRGPRPQSNTQHGYSMAPRYSHSNQFDSESPQASPKRCAYMVS